MATTHELTSPRARRSGAHAAPRRGTRWPATLLPAAVALAFTAAQLLLVVAPGLTVLGWDESVYVSQVAPHIPAAFFSAPRARGVPALVAPMVMLTSSTVALRVYLALLSGAALFFALRVWRPLVRPSVLALAGALFASLWVTLLYGPQAMPNLWVALIGLAAVGWFLRAAAPGPVDRAAFAGLGLSFVALTLLRPHDAAWLALPLGIAALLARGGRRTLLLLAVLAAGVVLGGAQWAAEAVTSYGGVLERLRRSSEIEGGFGWHVAVADQLSTLDGTSLLCRPCDAVWEHRADAVWWFVLPVLAAAGTVLGRPAAVRGVRALPALCGLSLALPYLLFIDYAAPRFLLPAYALLTLPAAACLARLPALVRPALRPAVLVAVAVALAAQLAGQQVVLHRAVRIAATGNGDYLRIATRLHQLGVLPPCLVTGPMAGPVGYQARCASGQVAGHNGDMTAAEVARAALHRPVAVIMPPHRLPPAYARSWPSRPLTGLRHHHGYRVLLSPR
ncbi:hypothetical protein ACFWVC_05605 [Streptomyces sp. NPDC058691]|uniref:hypothetical protein n=1 Tax=Streptomyces sp. NPDC058691 TaxID=3346601 RepID=UPI0036469229